MSIHSPLRQGVAPDARQAPAPTPGEGQTLTLQLRVVPGGMSGRLVVRGASPAPDGVSLRLVAPKEEPLTFTP